MKKIIYLLSVFFLIVHCNSVVVESQGVGSTSGGAGGSSIMIVDAGDPDYCDHPKCFNSCCNSDLSLCAGNPGQGYCCAKENFCLEKKSCDVLCGKCCSIDDPTQCVGGGASKFCCPANYMCL